MRLRKVLALAICVACGESYGSDPQPGALDSGTDAAANDGGGPSDDAGADATSAADASDGGDARAGECPTGLGPSMRKVTLAGGRAICVDQTEVTSAQYSTFRAALTDTAPLSSKVPTGCAPVAPVALASADVNPTNLPKVNVSFCSAAFYCAAQGKRLCGNAVDGSEIIVGEAGTEPANEWELACANGQSSDFYPWGTKDPSTAPNAGCVVAETDAGAARAVGVAQNCGPSGGTGPFDMIGNVWEWVNARKDIPGVSYTSVRGGGYPVPTVPLGCASTHAVNGPQSSYAPGASDIGFRCCANAN